MEICDVSVPLRAGMVTYPGDPQVHIERAASIAGGDVVNLTRIDFGLHSGTHVDAPVCTSSTGRLGSMRFRSMC